MSNKFFTSLFFDGFVKNFDFSQVGKCLIYHGEELVHTVEITRYLQLAGTIPNVSEYFVQALVLIDYVYFLNNWGLPPLDLRLLGKIGETVFTSTELGILTRGAITAFVAPYLEDPSIPPEAPYVPPIDESPESSPENSSASVVPLIILLIILLVLVGLIWVGIVSGKNSFL